MDGLTIEVEPRATIGRKVRALRLGGITPVHLYGKGTASVSLQADSTTLQKVVVQAGRNVPINVSIKGSKGSRLAFIREVQRHPVNEDILHVDFYQVPLAETMRAQVPVYLTGEAPAVKMHGGIMVQALHTIEVECLPLEVPQYIEVDVTGLEDFEQAIYVSSITLDESVEIISAPSELIVRVNPPRVAVEVEEVAAEAEAAEGAAPPEEEAEAGEAETPPGEA